MHILQVDLQSVRALSPKVQLTLKPGYLILKPPSPQTPQLGALLTALFFPDGRGGDAGFAVTGAAERRARVILQSTQAVYLIVRELGSSGGLYRREADGSEELVTEDAQEVITVLRAAGLPARTTYDDCFTLSADQLPSRRGLRKSAGSAAAGADKLAALQKELESAREVDQLQTRVDSLNRELNELDATLAQTQTLEQAVAEAQRAYETAPTPESLKLSTDIVERLHKFPQLVFKRDETIARLRGEPPPDPNAPKRVCLACGKVHREGEGHGASAAPKALDVRHAEDVRSVLKDPAFWGGVGLGLASLVGGAMGDGIWRYIAITDIPAFGFAGLKALEYVDALQAEEKERVKYTAIASTDKKVRSEFEKEAAPVLNALKSTDTHSPEELLELLGQRDALYERYQAVLAQLQPLLEDPAYQAAGVRRAELQREVSAASASLSEKGAYVRDLREVQSEVQKVKAAMLAEQERAAQQAKAGTQAPLEDPSPTVLAHAADLFTCDIAAAGELLKERCAQYLAALTDKRYSGVAFGKDGRASVRAGTQAVLAKTLPASDLDLFYLSLRLTVVEKYSARVKLPFVLDEPFATVPPPKLQLLARMLKHLGTLTQVVHVTTNPGFATAADANLAI